MQKVALVLSLVAVALAGWLAWNAVSSEERVDRLRRDLDGVAALEARVAALEGTSAPGPAAPRLAEALSAPPPPAGGDGAAPAGGGAAAPAAPRVASVPGRVADLEKRLAALEEKTAGTSASPIRVARPALTTPAGGRVYMSVDDAKEDLDLTDQQKGDFERILADARREADDLRRIPDDEGKTWEQVQRETFTAEGGAWRFDMSKVDAFRKKPVPGRSETFGQADQRIRETAKRRLRDTLSTAQQEKFAKASPDPMLGGGGGAGFITSFVVGTDSARTPDGK